MSKLKYISIIMCIMIFSFTSYSSPKVKENMDMVNKIISDCQCDVVEYGIKMNFISENDVKKTFYTLSDKLNILDCSNVNSTDSNKSNYIEFKGNNINGFIQSNNVGKYYKISINIIINDKKNDLLSVKNEIIQALCIDENDIDIYWYIKTKALNSTFSIWDINKKVSTILKRNETVNINTLKINNGYCTTAYTKKFIREKVNDNWIDFNFAVCKYNSGTYLLIGTPEIFISY